MTEAHASAPAPDDNQLIAERREKLAALRAQARAQGQAVFPNDFKPKHRALELQRKHGEVPISKSRSPALPMAQPN